MKIVSPSNVPTFKPQQTQSEQQQEQQLALLERIVRQFYFFHLIVIALVYTFVLVEYKISKQSFTFVLLVVYCYMIVWNWVINFFLVVIGKDNVAVVFNRVIIRFIIMLFSPLGLTAIIIDNYFGVKIVLGLIIYMCFISFLFFLYEIYGCTLGQTSNPKYIFQHNDLKVETEKVWEIRRKFNIQILSNKEDSIQE